MLRLAQQAMSDVVTGAALRSKYQGQTVRW
jgi:hypothetical protein